MADHHGLLLTPVHRCSSQARQTSDTPQALQDRDLVAQDLGVLDIVGAGRIKISAVFQVSSRRDSRSHEVSA
jgi:hypothetical protein